MFPRALIKLLIEAIERKLGTPLALARFFSVISKIFALASMAFIIAAVSISIAIVDDAFAINRELIVMKYSAPNQLYGIIFLFVALSLNLLGLSAYFRKLAESEYDPYNPNYQ